MTSPSRPGSSRTLAFGLLLLGCLTPIARGDDPPPVTRSPQPNQEPPAGVMPPPPTLPPPMPPAPVSLIPAAPAPIPDNPPPHEGAMFDYPLTLEPADIIVVEVVEALPGRPITGERLVRYDGTISLGFYGDVHVRGLTPSQAKVKIIHHLRNNLSDVMLGLVGYTAEAIIDGEGIMDGADAPPAGSGGPMDVPKPQSPPDDPAVNKPPGTEKQSDRPAPQTLNTARRPKSPRVSLHLTSRSIQEVQVVPVPDRPLPTAHRADVLTDPFLARPRDPLPIGGYEIDPLDSLRVFVEITKYVSKVYYILGDVGSPGRITFTGKDTVLDAINYAGGFTPSAEPADIHLYRPAQGDKPAKDFIIDYAAILKGDAIPQG